VVLGIVLPQTFNIFLSCLAQVLHVEFSLLILLVYDARILNSDLLNSFLCEAFLSFLLFLLNFVHSGPFLSFFVLNCILGFTVSCSELCLGHPAISSQWRLSNSACHRCYP